MSVNAWSFEKKLGPMRMMEWDENWNEHRLVVEPNQQEMTIPQLLNMLGNNGFYGVEIPYGNIQLTSEENVNQLWEKSRYTGVQLTSLLLDYGDLSSEDEERRQRDIEWYKRWIDIAGKAGFISVRIPGGEAEPEDEEALQRSVEGMLELADYADSRRVRVLTENLGRLLSTSDNCRKLLDACEGNVGLTVDFGNFKTDKYRQLAVLLPFAYTVHAKAELDSRGEIDWDDFRACLDLCAEAGFRGAMSFTYLGEGDEWSSILQLKEEAETVFVNRV
ncbi:sugar phosphate isomerase/epimerase family protein [Paenibacillus tarimensis]|nr:sugar phosphate isomerase/epimerase family protein [Paenibacillus tarimensis]MCF2944758.1 sugar phosphate isomerase/epimerase [Paenibacillus tarimensis]